MDKAKFFKVKSFSLPGAEYDVMQLQDGEWKCSCPNFIFNEHKRARLGKTTMCDHIRKIRHLKMKNHGRNKK